MGGRAARVSEVQTNFSNTKVAWMRSPPPIPLLPEAAVVMVWRR